MQISWFDFFLSSLSLSFSGPIFVLLKCFVSKCCSPFLYVVTITVHHRYHNPWHINYDNLYCRLDRYKRSQNGHCVQFVLKLFLWLFLRLLMPLKWPALFHTLALSLSLLFSLVLCFNFLCNNIQLYGLV